MKVVFAGTPEFAARCLESILGSRHVVCSVLTRPDRPAGRGLAPSHSAVKRLATERGIAVDQPASLKDPGLPEELGRREPEILVVASYGLILPRALLDLPRYGAVNIHASLLPRWRGAAPIQRAILAGDRETGISIMQMDEGLDTGPVLRQRSIPIAEEDTAGTLHDRLAALGGRLIVDVLGELEAEGMRAMPQPAEGATYAAKFDKREFRLDWNSGAVGINRLVRALSPSPGASTRIRGIELKIWKCAPVLEQGRPGEVLRSEPGGVTVACGQGAVLLKELQRSGGKRLSAAEFLRGFPLSAGERFDTPGG
ncbi:MAG: methionyl-tRNA formyltransferase [Burkholderiales bacterium]